MIEVHESPVDSPTLVAEYDRDRRGVAIFSRGEGERVIMLHVAHHKSGKAHTVFGRVVKRKRERGFVSVEYTMFGGPQFKHITLRKAIPRYNAALLATDVRNVAHILEGLLRLAAFDTTTEEGSQRLLDIVCYSLKTSDVFPATGAADALGVTT